MVVGSFASVPLDPPLVGFFPDKGSTSWPRIERAGKFCVNVLASDQEQLCRRFEFVAVDVDRRSPPVGLRRLHATFRISTDAGAADVLEPGNSVGRLVDTARGARRG